LTGASIFLASEAQGAAAVVFRPCVTGLTSLRDGFFGPFNAATNANQLHLPTPSKSQVYPHDKKISTRGHFGSQVYNSPSKALELNRLWLCDTLPRNSESWFVSRCLHELPPRLVLSYADTARGHAGYVYRALNFHYAGWTDMERKTPRYDYIVPGKHTRDAFRGGEPQWTERIRREPKVKYWTATGNRRERRDLAKICGWPILSWVSSPHPPEAQFEREMPSAA
jgi:hypothetical protein